MVDPDLSFQKFHDYVSIKATDSRKQATAFADGIIPSATAFHVVISIFLNLFLQDRLICLRVQT